MQWYSQIIVASVALPSFTQDAPPAPPPPADKGPESGVAEPPRGIRKHEAGAFAGYTLLSPLQSLRTVLLDMDGKVVFEWKSAFSPGNSVYLLENGNLLRCRRISDGGIFEGGGIGGGIEEFAPDGSIVWQYRLADEQRHHHHDIEPLQNGNILLILWERKSGTKAAEAGRDKERLEAGEFWPDAIVEIEKQPNDGARIVWEWHAWDHLIQDHDPDAANYGDVAAHPELIDINGGRAETAPPRPAPPTDGAKPGDNDADKLKQAGYLGGAARDDRGRRRNIRGADWLHSNGIDYNPALDQIVLSVHNFDEFWVIDHSTTTEEAKGHVGGRYGRGGDLLYRFGNPKAYRAGTAADQVLFGQHDAQWIEPGLPGAGNFLVFNNGQGRSGEPFSTVDEIAPPIDEQGRYTREAGAAFGPRELTWRYGGTDESRFYSSFISGTQRLPNGNTLICSGADGRVFEVTPGGEIVWEFLNDIGGDAPQEPRQPAPDRDGPAGKPPTDAAGPGGPPPAGGPGGPGGPGGAGGPRGGPGGPGGRGINPFALFRATRIGFDHPGLKALGLAPLQK